MADLHAIRLIREEGLSRPVEPIAAPAVGGSDRERFLLRLAELLHRHGMSTPRLEEELVSTAKRLGVEAQFLATPTSLLVSFGCDLGQRAVLLRSNQGDAELGKLVEIAELVERVDELGVAEGERQLERLARAEPRYGVSLVAIAFALAAATAARFFGGGWIDSVCAGLLSGAIGLAPRLLPARRNPVGLLEPFAAFVVACCAMFASRVLGFGVTESVVTLSALIVLVPGLSITIAMHELATRHLVAGGSRLAGAATVLLGLGLGIAIAQRLGERVFGPVAPFADPVAGGPLSLLAALAIAPISFGLLFQARARDLLWISLCSWLGFAASQAAAGVGDPALSGLSGALAVGLVARVWARRTRRPALVLELPGILPLVPGTLGLRSFDLFLASNPSAGAAAAFETALVSASLVGGLLVAHALLPAKLACQESRSS